MSKRKPAVGLFTFTCCEGCGFTILFIDKITEILEKIDVKHFNLLKETDPESEFNLVFVEGAITTKKEVKEIKNIRKNSKFLVALGACACHGGIPAMRNFLENDELNKYVYNPQMLEDSIPAQAIDHFVKVDYYMYGCPILKSEFAEFVDKFLKGEQLKEYEGPVCSQCPRRGKNCYLQEKKVCLGAMTHGGCEAICIQQDIPCIMCRGPLKTANFSAEAKLFKSWGLEEKDIINKLSQFVGVVPLDQKIKEEKKEDAKNAKP